MGNQNKSRVINVLHSYALFDILIYKNKPTSPDRKRRPRPTPLGSYKIFKCSTTWPTFWVKYFIFTIFKQFLTQQQSSGNYIKSLCFTLVFTNITLTRLIEYRHRMHLYYFLSTLLSASRNNAGYTGESQKRSAFTSFNLTMFNKWLYYYE